MLGVGQRVRVTRARVRIGNRDTPLLWRRRWRLQVRDSRQRDVGESPEGEQEDNNADRHRDEIAQVSDALAAGGREGQADQRERGGHDGQPKAQSNNYPQRLCDQEACHARERTGHGAPVFSVL